MQDGRRASHPRPGLGRPCVDAAATSGGWGHGLRSRLVLTRFPALTRSRLGVSSGQADGGPLALWFGMLQVLLFALMLALAAQDGPVSGCSDAANKGGKHKVCV